MDIFIIEDDQSLSNEIKLALSKWGYSVGQVNDFENITNEVLDSNPKLILMDINLPSYDGFYWCSQIRNFMKVPIIFISSRDNDMDIIMSINMGGDDYITKPFSPQVLVAKIQAILRRTYSYNNDLKSDVIKFKDITLNIVEGVLYKRAQVSQYILKPIDAIKRDEVSAIPICIQNLYKNHPIAPPPPAIIKYFPFMLNNIPKEYATKNAAITSIIILKTS